MLVTLDGPQHRCTLRQRTEDDWRPIRTVPRNGQAVAAALSRDQRRLVIGSDDGRIEAFDLEARPPRKLWSTHTSTKKMPLRMFLARNDRLLVTEVDGSAIVQDFSDLALGPPQIVSTATNLSVTVSPAGESLAIIADNVASVWSLISDPPEQSLPFTTSLVSEPAALTFSPDGQQLATAYKNGELWLHNLESGAVARKLQLPGEVRHLLYTDDNRHLITANGNGTIYVLRLADSKAIE